MARGSYLVEMTSPSPQLTIYCDQNPNVVGLLAQVNATINGFPVRLHAGQNRFPAPRGRHDIEIRSTLGWTYGVARLTVDNSAAGVREPSIYYRAPLLPVGRGAAGTEPVKRPGMLTVALVLVIAFAAVCAFGVYVDG